MRTSFWRGFPKSPANHPALLLTKTQDLVYHGCHHDEQSLSKPLNPSHSLLSPVDGVIKLWFGRIIVVFLHCSLCISMRAVFRISPPGRTQQTPVRLLGACIRVIRYLWWGWSGGWEAEQALPITGFTASSLPSSILVGCLRHTTNSDQGSHCKKRGQLYYACKGQNIFHPQG